MPSLVGQFVRDLQGQLDEACEFGGKIEFGVWEWTDCVQVGFVQMTVEVDPDSRQRTLRLVYGVSAAPTRAMARADLDPILTEPQPVR